MLNPEKTLKKLIMCGVDFFTGVPDSYLNDFCNYVLEHHGNSNVIAANEGNAVAIASGHYLATGKIPLVYMQNSGLGNALNPLVSLVDQNVYAIPMLLLIGWRGQGDSEPNHPQHMTQGRITEKLLELLNIKYTVLTDDFNEFERVIDVAVKYCAENRRPYALISPRGVMTSKEKNNVTDASYSMSREEAISTVMDHMPSDTIYSVTTGRATREMYFIRKNRGENLSHDFLNVGAMGHASSVAVGIALADPGRKIVVFDGDGAAIMHMGSLAIEGRQNIKNYLHIILNNGAHESVGGQPTVGHVTDFTHIAEACGFATVGREVTSVEELVNAVNVLNAKEVPGFIDCRIHKGISGKLPLIAFDHRNAVDLLGEELRK